MFVDVALEDPPRTDAARSEASLRATDGVANLKPTIRQIQSETASRQRRLDSVDESLNTLGRLLSCRCKA